ncbi:hypothetical protein E2C01_056306 [Portunus trituberculatus]|uniref:Uncharacterized protein n=1 Tax=Portunus trituberculatus TaxID=210409 RepID=A0A5B7GTR5_PORTR|nr:hypothetical protein [Portunus trituberculatus]
MWVTDVDVPPGDPGRGSGSRHPPGSGRGIPAPVRCSSDTYDPTLLPYSPPTCLSHLLHALRPSCRAWDPVAGRVTSAPSEPGVKCSGERSSRRWRNLLSPPPAPGTGPLGRLIHDN